MLLPFSLPGSALAEEAAPQLNLDQAEEYSRTHDGYALMVMRNDTILLERYANGASEETPQRIASIVKNLWGVVTIAAIEDRLLDFDEKLSRVIHEWEPEAVKKQITVRQLLSMISGMAPGFKELYLKTPRDAPHTALKLPAVAAPGNEFQYGPANMEILGEVFKRVLAATHRTPLQYLEQRLLGPLGIRYAEWKTDLNKNPRMSAGVKMRARDLLTLGRLVLHRGSVDGNRIVEAGRFDEALGGTWPNPMYGMTFWYNTNAASPGSLEINVEEVLEQKEPFTGWRNACIAHAAPRDLIAMIGSGNQRVYVVPSLDMVLVRQGFGTSFSDAEFWRVLLG